MPSLTSAIIPKLSDRVIIVTGGNVGLGFETIRQLREHNPARIYLAARSQDKADAAIQRLERLNPNGSPIRFLKLDLASFDSVKAAAAAFLRQESRLDILMNNAGIMMTPEGLSEDGYEIQFGTNVMGPALFTQLLLPILRKTAQLNPQTRVVMLSSSAHSQAPKDIYKFDQLRTTMQDRRTTARYTISKLADLHYAKALANREQNIKVIPVHPGMVATNLHHASTGFFLKPFLHAAVGMLATPVEQGALSQIWAAVSPDAKTGQYYGPIGKEESGSKLSQSLDLQESMFRWIQSELEGYVEVLQ
ncbi:NAD(P)-binding domain protein [Cordyceps fumosorosea ARSEF 2679]|uniref:NAD(P)-binding domain protein n=1 Tax=Cordyceps fumosorosea (strain ARSEF 2679) TaxID=1081104 RepID=A0A162JQ15_CORFA|nr:NAD(P)-binding domain protein [Cordyceps fumosorosea ARSEF 2679]OAA45373.1 NAD(P)-binding domain protein [Cordyceps fumosorosea ARSEF 2679]